MATTAIDWHAKAAAIGFDGRAVIDGLRCDAQSGETFAKHSPIDGRILGPVARGREADIDAAVKSARAAFTDGRWCAKPPAARKKILQRFAERILAAREELALLETLDMGKPIQDSLAVEAGIPPGVFTVVPGYGHEAGEALALHMDVDAIGFTGSTRVGRKMLEYAGRSNLKRVYNELGGKSAFLVFEDYAHLERAAQTAAGSLFFNQGESCNAPSRVLVHERVADRFVEIVAAEAPQYRPADPLEASTVMGALVDEGQMRTVLGYIEAGVREGARTVTGGQRALEASGGYYVEPTVFDGVANGMTIAREEIFGPVMSIIRFKTEAEAVALANASNYGLQASVWSDNLSRAHRVARALRAGTVHVNQYDEDDITVPFGGYKQSGNGRDKSLHALEKYTQQKTTWIRIDPPP